MKLFEIIKFQAFLNYTCVNSLGPSVFGVPSPV